MALGSNSRRKPPRSQFGFAFTSVMHVLHVQRLAPEAIYQAFGSAADHLIANQSNCIERAEALADLVEGKQVLLYSDAAQEGLTIRWRQQLQ